MRDVWKSALEWYIYCTDPKKKSVYACVIMRVKDRLRDISNKGDLFHHYMSTDGLCEEVVAELFPGVEWLDYRRIEDVAYGVRCLEIATGKSFNLLRQAPSRWLIETMA